MHAQVFKRLATHLTIFSNLGIWIADYYIIGYFVPLNIAINFAMFKWLIYLSKDNRFPDITCDFKKFVAHLYTFPNIFLLINKIFIN